MASSAGPRFCGLVAATPVIATAALAAGYRQGGTPRMLRVLSGYLDLKRRNLL